LVLKYLILTKKCTFHHLWGAYLRAFDQKVLHFLAHFTDGNSLRAKMNFIFKMVKMHKCAFCPFLFGLCIGHLLKSAILIALFFLKEVDRFAVHLFSFWSKVRFLGVI